MLGMLYEKVHEVLDILLKLLKSPEKRAAIHQQLLFIQNPWWPNIWNLSASRMSNWMPLHIIAQEGLINVYNLISDPDKKSSIPG